MANEVTDTLQCEDQLAGVALLSAAQHRKRASTFGDPIHLHKRSSSLVSDLTIDGLLGDDKSILKCPRVLERSCPSPDALGSPTGTSVLQPPSTPSTCGGQPAALLHQPNHHRAGALPPSPLLGCAVPGQQQQPPPAWQQQVPRLSRRSCPGSLGLSMLRSPAVAAAGACGMHPPASPGTLSSTPRGQSCSPAAAAAAPPLHLNSLMLVASQLDSSSKAGVCVEACAAGDSSSSPLLPATQAALQATTAGVVAAELTAAAAAGQAAQMSAGAAAVTAAADTPVCQLELPSWLRSGSAGLAASAAICRASLLSTTAALARLSQQQPASTSTAMQQEQQQVPASSPAGPAVPSSAARAAPVPMPHAPVLLQQPGVQCAAGAVALGIPVAGGVVLGMPVHQPQQQQQQVGVTGRPLDFRAADACAAGQLCMSSLRSPAATTEQMQQGSMQCDDATSCCSTPRSGAAAAAVPSEDVRQVADAAARLLLSSSCGSRRRRFCWEADVEAMDEEQCSEDLGSDGESAEVTSAAAGAAAAAAADAGVVANKAAASGQQAACAQQLAMAVGDAAACAVVVVVDVAAKRSSAGSKEAAQLDAFADAGVAGAHMSSGYCGESM